MQENIRYGTKFWLPKKLISSLPVTKPAPIIEPTATKVTEKIWQKNFTPYFMSVKSK